MQYVAGLPQIASLHVFFFRLCSCVGQVPGWLVRQVAHLLAPDSGGPNSDSPEAAQRTVALCPQKVTRFRGRQLLRKQSVSFYFGFIFLSLEIL